MPLCGIPDPRDPARLCGKQRGHNLEGDLHSWELEEPQPEPSPPPASPED